MTYAAPQLKPKLRLELDVVVEVELKLKSGVSGGAGGGVATHNTQPRGRLGLLDWAFVLTFDWQLTKRREIENGLLQNRLLSLVIGRHCLPTERATERTASDN